MDGPISLTSGSLKAFPLQLNKTDLVKIGRLGQITEATINSQCYYFNKHIITLPSKTKIWHHSQLQQYQLA